MQIQVTVFDSKGVRSSAELLISNDYLKVGSQLLKKDSYVVESPISGVPVIIKLLDGSRIEVPYSKSLVAELESYRHLSTRSVFKMETNLRVFFGVLVTSIAVFIFIIKVALPKSSSFIAQNVPNSWAKKLDETILDQLDKSTLGETELEESTQEKLRSIFKNHGLDKYKIVFRKGNLLKANAFALSFDTIIVTDELINHLNQGKLILSIVLHEESHLKRKHVLSQLISDSAITLFSLYLFGDFAGSAETVAQLSFTLMARNYSQNNELQADSDSALKLEEFKISSNCLEMALEKLHSYHNKDTSDEKSFLDFLSTHPPLSKRVMNLEKISPSLTECIIE